MILVAVTDYPAGLQSWEAVISSDSGFSSEKELPLDFPVLFEASGNTSLVIGFYRPDSGQFDQKEFKFNAVDRGVYRASILTGSVTDFWPKDTVEKAEGEPMSNIPFGGDAETGQLLRDRIDSPGPGWVWDDNLGWQPPESTYLVPETGRVFPGLLPPMPALKTKQIKKLLIGAAILLGIGILFRGK